MTPPTTATLTQWITELVTPLVTRLDDFFGITDAELNESVAEHARNLAIRLAAAPDTIDPIVQARAATQVRALVRDGNFIFWRTDLGQIVARLIGYGKPYVPRQAAAAILGVSRQRVHQLIRDGVLVEIAQVGADEWTLLEGQHRLDTITDGYPLLTNESVLARLRGMRTD